MSANKPRRKKRHDRVYVLACMCVRAHVLTLILARLLRLIHARAHTCKQAHMQASTHTYVHKAGIHSCLQVQPGCRQDRLLSKTSSLHVMLHTDLEPRPGTGTGSTIGKASSEIGSRLGSGNASQGGGSARSGSSSHSPRGGRGDGVTKKKIDQKSKKRLVDLSTRLERLFYILAPGAAVRGRVPVRPSVVCVSC